MQGSPRAATSHRLEAREISAADREPRRSVPFVVGRYLLIPALSITILSGCMFFDEIDRCLDRGGMWNDTKGICEFDDPEARYVSAFAAGTPTTSAERSRAPG